MGDVRERFHQLDRLVAPDQWRDIETRVPAETDEPHPWRRVGVALLALAVAVAGTVVAIHALGGTKRSGLEPVPIVPKANGRILFISAQSGFPFPFLGPDNLYTMNADGSDVRQITNGQSTTLSVSATGTGLTYQWFGGSSGFTGAPQAGATGPSFTVSPTVTSQYWVRVSNACGSVNSNTATVTVH